eukprot:7321042-Prymnesium_polylepis.1
MALRMSMCRRYSTPSGLRVVTMAAPAAMTKTHIKEPMKAISPATTCDGASSCHRAITSPRSLAPSHHRATMPSSHGHQHQLTLTPATKSP